MPSLQRRGGTVPGRIVGHAVRVLILLAAMAIEAAAGATTTEEALFAEAAGARPGDTLLLAESLMRRAGPDLPALAALRGDTPATLVGFTDFRRGPPADLDYEARSPVEYRNAQGLRRTTPAPEGSHPMWGGAGEWFEAPEVPSLPLDHVRSGSGWMPVGLRLDSDRARPGSPALPANSIGHNAIPHDGHVVWLAEYLRADRSRLLVWLEREDSRAANPRLVHPAAADAAPRATHLLRLLTLRIAAHDALPRADPADTLDPRRWRLAPKRLRDAHPPAYRAQGWDDAMAHIAALPDDALPAGGSYVIELPPGPVRSRDALLQVPQDARARLARPGTGRVFLIGTPGRTILPNLTLTDAVPLDLGWLTITPLSPDPPHRESLVFVGAGHVRFFGTVIDGFDGSLDGIQANGGIVEFHDGYIGGVGNAIAVGGSADTDPARTPRILVARSLIDASNDAVAKYGPGSVRLESNYLYGRGGAWRNGGFLHADLLGQYHDARRGPTDHRLALYDNVLDAGPNTDRVLSLRGAPNLMMVQGGRFHVADIVGNVLVQPPTGGGFQRLARTRRRAGTGEEEQNWFGAYRIAENILLSRPDAISPGHAYPEAEWTGLSGLRDIDAWSADSNLLSVAPAARPGSAAQAGWTRMVALLPEEAGLPGRPDADRAFRAFPRTHGSWMGGYRLDWSGTAHAGTSREGHLSPADVVLPRGSPLRRWGRSQVRGLPFDAARTARLTDLPADMRRHLGWTGADGNPLPGAGYGADWFGGWRPEPFALDAVLRDPWGPPPGRDTVEEHALVISTHVERLAEGTLREEIDAAEPAMASRIRIEREGDAFYPVFEQTDAQGRLTHRARSAVPLEPGPLLIGVSLIERRHRLERFQTRALVRRLAFERFEREGRRIPLAIELTASENPPFATPPAPVAGVERLFVWLDRRDAAEPLKRWDGAGWSPLQGDLSRIVSVAVLAPLRAALRRAGHAEDDPRRLDAAVLARMPDIRRVWLIARSLADTPMPVLDGIGRALRLGTGGPAPRDGAADAPALADTLTVALEEGPYPRAGHSFRWEGRRWVAMRRDAFDHPDADQLRGEIAVHFRIAGQPPVLGPDWIWGAHGTRGARLARGTLRLGAATADPFRGTVRWYEERRMRAANAIGGQPGPLEVPISALAHRFARAPLDPATGRRDHPLLPGRDDPDHGGIVWLAAPRPRP